MNIPLQRGSVTHRPERSIDSEVVRREVIERLRRGEIPTVTQLQRRFGADDARITDLLSSKLRSRLKIRSGLRRLRENDGRFRVLIAKIVATRSVLAAMGRPVGAEEVAIDALHEPDSQGSCKSCMRPRD